MRSVRGDAEDPADDSRVPVSQVRGETARAGVSRGGVGGADGGGGGGGCAGGRAEAEAADAEEAEEKASAREKASGDRLAETRRAAREELERHVAFSKSLEDVVEALARRLAPSRARVRGVPDVDLAAAPLRAKI